MVQKTEIIGQPPPPVGWLVVRSGRRSGRDYRLAVQTTVGRDAMQCDLILDDESVSAEHATIKYERGQFVLYDLASTNGTFLNGEKVQRTPLADGDAITFGHTKVVFKMVEPSEA